VRACEYSHELESGTACVYREAIVNGLVEEGGADLTIECPAARDSEREPGGVVALYSAPVLPGDDIAELDCTAVLD
jgi:hypothetical protein